MKKTFTARFKIALFFLISFFGVRHSYAQWYDPEKVNKKAAALHEEAYYAAQEGKYDIAIAKTRQAIAMEPKFVDAYLSQAGMYANLKKYDSSVINFEKGLALIKNVHPQQQPLQERCSEKVSVCTQLF